jgi:NAD(P)-dependent dehydrogenase (short-subunit alcohol dehydrogenase family)
MKEDPFSLDAKIALVTGASRGIGESIARLFATRGAHVIVSNRKLEGCQLVADSIKANGGSAEAVACHTGELDHIEAIYKHIDESHAGRIDILVNNAGTNPYFGPIADTEVSAFQKTIDVNMRGYFYMSTNAVRRMRETGGGAIVNVASVNGIKPAANQGIYSITKAAVINMSQAFVKECGEFNIRVNTLAPGLVETKFAEALHTNPELRKQVESSIPISRIAQPDEISTAALFLVSDAGSYTTASCVTVDGGLLGAGGL